MSFGSWFFANPGGESVGNDKITLQIRQSLDGKVQKSIPVMNDVTLSKIRK
jgi:hypothetical protein